MREPADLAGKVAVVTGGALGNQQSNRDPGSLGVE